MHESLLLLLLFKQICQQAPLECRKVPPQQVISMRWDREWLTLASVLPTILSLMKITRLVRPRITRRTPLVTCKYRSCKTCWWAAWSRSKWSRAPHPWTRRGPRTSQPGVGEPQCGSQRPGRHIIMRLKLQQWWCTIILIELLRGHSTLVCSWGAAPNEYDFIDASLERVNQWMQYQYQ